jgi:hypothetical protein
MADIAVATAGSVHVVESLWQKTLVATETIAAGAPVRIHTDGKWTNANGTTTTENRIWGIATKSVIAGEALTAIRRGTMDGFTFTQAYDAIIYLSDTDGRLGDVAGTVSTIVGRVVPGTAVVGTTYDKLLSVEL